MTTVGARPSTRERIITAAIVLTAERGWAALTMGGLADDVGVSRQTVYNEVGSKPLLAEAMVRHELAGFLAVVDAAFEEHPDDPVDAIRAATARVMSRAAGTPLLRTMLSVHEGGSAELLPMLATDAGGVLEGARAVLAGHLAARSGEPEQPDVDVVADAIARLVLSQVMNPSGTPAQVADRVGWVAERLLGHIAGNGPTRSHPPSAASVVPVM